jgi:hypothetical protein
LAQVLCNERFVAEEDAGFLQRIAWETIREYQSMP